MRYPWMIAALVLGYLGLVATLIFMPLILAYTAWVFRVLRGRITLEHIRSGGSGY